MSRVRDPLKIFGNVVFISSYTDVITFKTNPSEPEDLFLLRDLNAFSNSSSINGILFNVAFAFGRYD